MGEETETEARVRGLFDPAVLANCEVCRCDYSSQPWRIVHRVTGKELWGSEVFDHPTLGPQRIPAPFAFDRKRDAVAALGDLLAYSAEKFAASSRTGEGQG